MPLLWFLFGGAVGGVLGAAFGAAKGMKIALVPIALDPSLSDAYLRSLHVSDPAKVAQWQGMFEALRREYGTPEPERTSQPSRPPQLPPPAPGRFPPPPPPHAAAGYRTGAPTTTVPAGQPEALRASFPDIPAALSRVRSLVAQGDNQQAASKPNLAVASYKMAGAFGSIQLGPMLVAHLGDDIARAPTDAAAATYHQLTSIPTTFDVIWEGLGSGAHPVGNGRPSTAADAASAKSLVHSMLSVYERVAAPVTTPVAATGWWGAVPGGYGYHGHYGRPYWH
jgi:hypothetical protein